MARKFEVTMQDEIYKGLIEYLDREFGDTRQKSLIINVGMREFLQRKGILPNPGGKTRPDQGSLFKE